MGTSLSLSPHHSCHPSLPLALKWPSQFTSPLHAKQCLLLAPFNNDYFQGIPAALKSKDTSSLKKSYDKLRQHIKKKRHHFADKGPYSQCSHVWMWELGHKEGWVPKNWCFWTVLLEKTLESPLDSKEIKPVNPKGYQLWIFTGRTDAEAETLILWLPDVKSQLIRKDLILGKIEGGRRGGWQDKMVGWHHRLDGHEFEQAPGVGDGPECLACCKESDMTERLN